MSDSRTRKPPIPNYTVILESDDIRLFDADLPEGTIARIARDLRVHVIRLGGGGGESSWAEGQEWFKRYKEKETTRGGVEQLRETVRKMAEHGMPLRADTVSFAPGTAGPFQELAILLESDPARAAEKVLNELVDAETDHAWRRRLVIAAEGIHFSDDEDRKLLPALMRFIEGFRDSNDREDQIAVCSAIRTYIGTVLVEEIDTVAVLLEPKHRTSATLDIVLETLKMIRRKLMVNPPAATDSHPALSEHVERLARGYVHPYVFAHGKHAAVAMNAVQALAGLASHRIVDVIDQVNRSCPSWFRRQLQRRLREQHAEWATRRPIPAAAHPPIGLLEEALDRLRTQSSEEDSVGPCPPAA